MKFHGQYGQDEYCYNEFFKDLKEGFFMEIGADDGVANSNTFVFEKLGWNGICVEPRRLAFDQLNENRSCICENICISDSIGDVKFLEIKGYGKALSGIISKYDKRHVDRIDSELSSSLGENSERDIISVRSETIESLLTKHGVANVDLCSIDTEGGELDIIKSIDFLKFNFKVFIVENNYNCNNMREYMASNGFVLSKKMTIDEIYVKGGEL